MHSLTSDQIERAGLKPGDRLIKYDSNNSGGSWWLKDEDWKALERAGWVVAWAAEGEDQLFGADKDGRYMGALAVVAFRKGLSMGEAIAEWERVTGQDSSDLGCGCCGAPHSFAAEEVYKVTAKERTESEAFHSRLNRKAPKPRKYDTRWAKDGESYRPSAPSKGDRYQ